MIRRIQILPRSINLIMSILEKSDEMKDSFVPYHNYIKKLTKSDENKIIHKVKPALVFDPSKNPELYYDHSHMDQDYKLIDISENYMIISVDEDLKTEKFVIKKLDKRYITGWVVVDEVKHIEPDTIHL